MRPVGIFHGQESAANARIALQAKSTSISTLEDLDFEHVAGLASAMKTGPVRICPPGPDVFTSHRWGRCRRESPRLDAAAHHAFRATRRSRASACRTVSPECTVNTGLAKPE